MIAVNGRDYRERQEPVVGVCLDGCAPEYLDASADLMPNLEQIRRKGCYGLVRTVIPSFTNPNNVAIVTGVPPRVNGICGNYYYDPDTDEEVLMNEPRFLRAPTLLAAFSEAGRAVAAVTVKDKLRLLLAEGLEEGICFSVEDPDAPTGVGQGIDDVAGLADRPWPDVYDPEASICCLECGVRILEARQVDLMYLSTTDYVQHKYCPDSPDARRYFARVDGVLGALDSRGVILGITADHGMNSKVRPDGTPKVEFLETRLREAGISARVILPITDPYLVHHGGLGSYATIYLDEQDVARSAGLLREVPGVDLVLTRAEAVERFALPGEGIGELVVLADRGTVLGRTPGWHDLSAVTSGLRSHGGLHEAVVPMILNRPVSSGHARRLASGEAQNLDLFDFLFNGAR
jgi:phosphonoacetate hydrolase